MVKATVLVAYLEAVARDLPLAPEEGALLEAMIRHSDNEATDRLVARIGASGLSATARRAGMRGFVPRPSWGLSQITAEDQAHLFLRIDELVPPPHRGYARGLLVSIVPSQRWGIPQAVPPGSVVLFKGGWLPNAAGAWRVHQVAKVEREGATVAVAVLSAGNPSRAYGAETVRGVAARLLD